MKITKIGIQGFINPPPKEVESLQKIVQDTVKNMKDPSVVKDFALNPVNNHPDSILPLQNTWIDLSLTVGYPGFLLLFAKLQEKGLVKEDIVHRYAVTIKECIETNGLSDLSLYSGVTGIAFALQCASFQGTRYQTMLEVLQRFLSKKIPEVYFSRVKKDRSIQSQDYDVILGLAGVGRYLLGSLASPSFYQLTQTIAEILVKMTHPLTIDVYSVPGWFLSPSDKLNRRNNRDLKGNFNLGLAHGVPGILSFFAIALIHGVEVPGQKDAMLRIISWIRGNAILTKNSIRWPYSISWEEEIEKRVSTQPCRDAWCYGVPGIARTLFLAGKALGDNELKLFAINAFRNVFSRSRSEWNLPGPALCHGIAGLLVIATEMAKESGCEDLSYQATKLRQKLLSHYQPDAPFGFKDVEISNRGEEIKVNKPGFLEGSAGILLALLEGSESTPQWHLPLMIND